MSPGRAEDASRLREQLARAPDDGVAWLDLAAVEAISVAQSRRRRRRTALAAGASYRSWPVHPCVVCWPDYAAAPHMAGVGGGMDPMRSRNTGRAAFVSDQPRLTVAFDVLPA